MTAEMDVEGLIRGLEASAPWIRSLPKDYDVPRLTAELAAKDCEETAALLRSLAEENARLQHAIYHGETDEDCDPAVEALRMVRQAYRNIMRETAILKRVKERYGLALMMIREGCAQPAKVAREALAWEPPEQEIANLDAALTERSNES